MARLELALLGAPEIRVDGHLLATRTRKTLALLIYLAAEGGPQPREKLTTLFWPESDGYSGRTSLRTTLLFLRRALADCTDEPDYIWSTRDMLGFNFDADYTLDVAQLEAAADLVTGSSPQTPTPRQIAQLQEAVNLYRGDFLEGFNLPNAPDFDEWASFQREYWHRQFGLVCDRLSEMQEEGGQLEAAVKTTMRRLAVDPLDEAAHRRLMRLQLASGDRGAALQTYESYRIRLAAELGVEPDPETQALVEQASQVHSTHHASREEATDRQTAAGQRKLVIPLVGRSVEHAELVTAFHRARRGQTQVVVIEGEAGIGKTRLVQAFLDWADARAALVLHGRAYEAGGRLLYQPIVEALRSWVSQTEGERERQGDKGTRRQGDQERGRQRSRGTFFSSSHLTLSLSPTWLSELSRLLPELREHCPDLPSPAEGEAARNRLFEAVARLAQHLARHHPIIFFLDDMQWADVASLDLLHYAGRRWTESNTPMLLLFALRAGARQHLARLPGTEALAPWLSSLQRDLMPTRLKLRPLTGDDVENLVGTLHLQAEAEKHTSLASWLYKETGGHPFYLTETLKALVEQGRLRWRPTKDSGWQLDATALFADDPTLKGFITPGVHEVIRSRFVRLTSTACSLLAAGAVLGQTFAFRQLCRVAGMDEHESLVALDELVAANLLIPIDRAYQFAHDKIRDVAYTEAGDARRRLYHERALALLQESKAAPAQLAHHALQAGLMQPAFAYHLAAGDDAMALFAVRDAINFYEQARQLLLEEETVEASPEQRRHLYERLGRGYELLNRWRDAGGVYQELLAFARDSELPTLTVAALNRLAGVMILGRWQADQAISHLEEARTIAAQQDDTAGLIQIECALSQVRQYEFDREAAVAHAERALQLARILADKELIARSLNILAYARFGPPAALPQIEAEASEARTIYRTLGNRALEADSLAMVAQAQIHSGRLHQAVPNLRTALTIAREIENSWGQVNASFHLAFALLEIGHHGEALDLIEEAVQTAHQHTHNALLAGVVCVRGTVYRAVGRLDEARADHEAAQARFAELGFALLPAILAVHCCADCILAGDWEAAHRYARQSLALEDLCWLWVWLDTGFYYPAVIEALWRGGEEAQARAALARYKAAVGDNPSYRIPYYHAQAIFAQMEGESDKAAAHLEAARKIAREFGLLGERGQ